MNENKYGHSATKVTNVVLVYGGALSAKTRPKLLNDVLQLASETKTWEVLQCDNTLSPRYFHSAVAYKNSLFIFGGKTEHGYSNDLHEFNTQTKIWTKIEQKNTKKKPTPRYGHASVACGREMFTFGGCDINGEIDNNLYIFDLITHEWKQKKHIPSVPKSYHHTLVFDEGGYLYILGGRTNKQQALTNVTKINPISFSVERCPSLPTPRYGHISFFKNGELTVLGGCDFEKDYNSGYKLVKDKWEETLCEHFEHGSVFSSVVIVNDEEMLVGGTRKNKPNDTIFDRYTAHLGDSVLHILQYLPLNDIQSIRATSKHWNVAIYARYNTFWKTVYEKLRSNVFMKRIWTEHETSINEIIEQSLVDTYLRAVCHMYNIQRTFCNDQPKRNKLLVDKHKVVRGKKQHYGIPTEPRFIHYLPQEKTGYQLNVQLVGSGAVGKSTMIDTFLTGFPCDPILTPTFVSSANKTLMVGNTPVEMVIYDCHAMEDYGNLRKVAYPNIDLFLVIFCVSSPKSFEEVITTWIPEIRSVVANPLILLCGSKIDTRDDETVHDQLQKRGYKVIDKEEGEYMAKEFGCIGYVENSGITQVGLEETFSAVLRCGGANYADSKEFKQKKACRIT